MKTIALCKGWKTAVDPLGSRVPGRRSEPIAPLAKALPAPAPTDRPQPKNGPAAVPTGKSPTIQTCFPLLLATNLKWETRLVQPRIVRRLSS